MSKIQMNSNAQCNFGSAVVMIAGKDSMIHQS